VIEHVGDSDQVCGDQVENAMLSVRQLPQTGQHIVRRCASGGMPRKQIERALDAEKIVFPRFLRRTA
jgi:hypothetical protein